MLKRFTILLIIVLTAAIAITGLTSFLLIRGRIGQMSQNALLTAARMVQAETASGLGIREASERVLPVFSQQEPQLRLTVIDRQGAVLFDSVADQETMDNHLSRPEVLGAIRSGATGSAVRRSATLKQDMLYVALFDPAAQIVIRTATPLDIYQAGVNQILAAILITLGSSLLILLLVSTFSTRLISRPLLALKNAAQSLAAGRYETRVSSDEDSQNEIGSLSHSFNSMAERLQQVVGDLEDRNARLDVILNAMSDPLLVLTPATTVTYMNKAAQEIFGRKLDPAGAVFPLFLLTHRAEVDQTVAAAAESGRMASADCVIQTVRGEKTYQVAASPILTGRSVILTLHDISENRRLQAMRSEFVANVTHELRTPLTSIRGFIETLRSGAISQPDIAARFLEIIDIEAERLHKLISDILTLSEIEEQRAEKDRETFDLRALIDEVAVLLEDQAAARRVTIAVEDPDVALPVSANPFRIKQILINLVENAIKYNYEGGKVFIHADRQPEGLVSLQVRDTGPGIPAEHQERVFERFYRVDKGRSREMGGTGLGLSIVKHIALLYGGSAALKSQPGEGSTFTVRLRI